MNWPEALVRELAERRCCVFMGAGASAGSVGQDGSTRPPTWEGFLVALSAKMNTAKEKETAEALIGEKKFLEAAEIIYADVAQPDFSQFVRDTLVVPRFQPSPVHEAVLQIDPKIVITTNYDDIYDNYCRTGDAAVGYNVSRYYDSHIVSDLRSPVRLIIKAHGCINDAAKIVLTRSSYFEQRRAYENFFKILDAIFLSSSLLFVGYSFSDPDFQLVLENANIAAPKSHPHFAVVSDAIHSAIKLSWSKAYNIHFIEFSDGNYEELNNGLAGLAADVVAFRSNHLA